MTHPLLIVLDDAEDVALAAAALMSRADQLATAATAAAGDTVTLRRDKADYRQQALAITRMLEESARLRRVSAAIADGLVVHPTLEVTAAALEAAVVDDEFDDLTDDDDEPEPDPLDPEADTPDAVDVFGTEQPTPDPAPQPALGRNARRRRTATPGAAPAAVRPVPAPEPDDPYEDVDRRTVPENAGIVTAQRIAAAKSRGALSALPPIPAEGEDGTTAEDAK